MNVVFYVIVVYSQMDDNRRNTFSEQNTAFFNIKLRGTQTNQCASKDLIQNQCISKNKTPTNKMLNNPSMDSSISDLYTFY
jgi:hypothetical protein